MLFRCNSDLHVRIIIYTVYIASGLPVVVFTNGVEQTVAVEKWSVRTGPGVVATRRQLPLKLAWAISIHKSQVSEVQCETASL